MSQFVWLESDAILLAQVPYHLSNAISSHLIIVFTLPYIVCIKWSMHEICSQPYRIMERGAVTSQFVL
jgi:hypothetical protein